MTLLSFITMQDGSAVLTDGKVGTEEGCCCETQGPCSYEMYFTYIADNPEPYPTEWMADSVPPGKWEDECPTAGVCPPNAQPPGRSCCDEVLTAKLYSLPFGPHCTGTPKATIYAGAAVDDYGTIGGVATTVQCGVLGVIQQDTTVTAEVEDAPDAGVGFVRLWVELVATNSPDLCGPYGAAGIYILFYFE